MHWDEYFVGIVKQVGTKAKDHTKFGAVIVNRDDVILATGFNGFPRGVTERAPRTDRPNKYTWTEHAERNAIYNAARVGARLLNSRMYVEAVPCAECCRGIVQAGIAEVIVGFPEKEVFDKERLNTHSAMHLLEEAGVKVRPMEGG